MNMHGLGAAAVVTALTVGTFAGGFAPQLTSSRVDTSIVSAAQSDNSFAQSVVLDLGEARFAAIGDVTVWPVTVVPSINVNEAVSIELVTNPGITAPAVVIPQLIAGQPITVNLELTLASDFAEGPIGIMVSARIASDASVENAAYGYGFLNAARGEKTPEPTESSSVEPTSPVASPTLPVLPTSDPTPTASALPSLPAGIPSASTAANSPITNTVNDLVVSAQSPVALGVTSAAPGGLVTFASTGFTPGESVEITLHSNPLHLLTGVADASGSIFGTFRIPDGAPAGEHHIVFVGGTSGVVNTLEFTVLAKSLASSAGSDKPLASTGANTAAIFVGGGLLALGAVVLVLRRRAILGQ